MSKQMWARVLLVAGLLLDLSGAVLVAYGAYLTPEQAGQIAVTRWAPSTKEEQATMPAAQNLLQQSRYATAGVILVAIGFGLQLAGVFVEVRGSSSAAPPVRRAAVTIGTLLALLVLACMALALGAWWHWGAIVQDASAAATWAQALAAILAMAATIYLLWLTVESVAHMQRQTDQREAPDVIGSIEPRLGRYVKFVVTNVGSGHARNVRLLLRSPDGERRWAHPFLQAGRFEEFNLPGAQAEWVAARLAEIDARIEARIEYAHQDGRPRVFELSVRVLELGWVADAGWQTREPAAERMVERVRELDKRLGEIRNQLLRLVARTNDTPDEDDDAVAAEPVERG